MLNAYVWYTITNSCFKLWCVFEIIVAVVDRDGKRRLLLRVPFVQCSKTFLTSVCMVTPRNTYQTLGKPSTL
jgi:hypothetical protein